MKYYIILPVIFLFLCCENTKLSEIRYTHSKTNVRNAKSTSSKIVKTLDANQKVLIVPSNKDWWLVISSESTNGTKSNKLGYIHKSLLHQNPIKQKVTSDKEPQTNESVSMVLDVEKLIGLNIEQIISIIGNPSSKWHPTYEQRQLAPNISSTYEWSSEDIGLSIDFYFDEKIMYIFVLNGGNYGVKYSTNDLMKMANLKYNSNRYSLKPQKAMIGSGITGIHVYGTN